jgi:hypothetical protein
MSHSVFSAHHIVFGGIKHGFQNIGTALRLAILPLVLMALIVGATTLMDLGTYAIIALSLPFLFVMMFTLPITCIHFANSGEIGHNITGHTTKGFWKYFVTCLKYILIMAVLQGLAGVLLPLITKSAPSSMMAFIFQAIIHLIIIYVSLRLMPLLVYSITEGTSSVRHTLRLTRHRVWFLVRCIIVLSLISLIFYLLLISVPLATLPRQVLDYLSSFITDQGPPPLKVSFTNLSEGLLLLNVLWGVALMIFYTFITSMVLVRIANVLKNNPPQS